MSTTKKQVRSDFTYARHLMRLAEQAMANPETDWEDTQAIANELIASVATFSQYVEDRKEVTA